MTLKSFFKGIAALCGALSTLGCALSASAAPASAEETLSPDRPFVWAHVMHCFPLQSTQYPGAKTGIYPQPYPLEMCPSIKDDTLTDVKNMVAAGVDGAAVNIFTSPSFAHRFLVAADKVGGIRVAACLDLSIPKDPAEKERLAVETIAGYAEMAAPFASVAKVGDAFVVFTYGTDQLPPDAWVRIRAALQARGVRTWWQPAVAARGDLAVMKEFPKALAESYLPVFESFYLFGSKTPFWDDLIGLEKASGRPFGGGMMPGYYRFGGGFIDACGTALYRESWEQHIATSRRWVTVNTWNDLSETSQIMPTSDMNETRGDLTRWYAARIKGKPTPFTEARLYVTTPKTIYPGDTAPVEALVLNGSSQPVRVRVRLTDGERNPVGQPVSVLVPAGQAGAAVIPLTVTSFPAGRFLRAEAAAERAGKTAARVASAPICVLSREAQPGYRTLYYSIPAHRALKGDGRFTLALDGPAPVNGREATARIDAPAGWSPRSVELIHNTAAVRHFFDRGPLVQTVPFREAEVEKRGNAGGQVAASPVRGVTEWGFYLARFIDAEGNVAYTDPVYVDPGTDLTVRERYAFDDTDAQRAADSSGWRLSGEMKNVQRIAPGADGKGGAVSFNGKDSRINLVMSLTPPGPVSITFDARPRAFGGAFFCDSGGLWIATNAAGLPTATRLAPNGKWSTIVGTVPLKLGEWARFEYRWEDGRSRLFVNGEAVAEGDAPPQFGSFRRALGCNPFGNGSSFYEGDIDNFEARSLSTAP